MARLFNILRRKARKASHKSTVLHHKTDAVHTFADLCCTKPATVGAWLYCSELNAWFTAKLAPSGKPMWLIDSGAKGVYLFDETD